MQRGISIANRIGNQAMPLIEDDDPSLPDPTRLSFRERLRSGRVVPIVSNRAIFDRMLGGYEPFLTGFARYVKFPLSLEQPDSLVTVVKFHKHRPREKPRKHETRAFAASAAPSTCPCYPRRKGPASCTKMRGRCCAHSTTTPPAGDRSFSLT